MTMTTCQFYENAFQFGSHIPMSAKSLCISLFPGCSALESIPRSKGERYEGIAGFCLVPFNLCLWSENRVNQGLSQALQLRTGMSRSDTLLSSSWHSFGYADQAAPHHPQLIPYPAAPYSVSHRPHLKVPGASRASELHIATWCLVLGSLPSWQQRDPASGEALAHRKCLLPS